MNNIMLLLCAILLLLAKHCVKLLMCRYILYVATISYLLQHSYRTRVLSVHYSRFMTASVEVSSVAS